MEFLLPHIDIVSKLILASFLGAIIGLERELHAQAAGLRTHMIVATASCLVMLFSIEIGKTTPGADPSRISSQVVSGIGFLGAAAVLRFGLTIRGLTTAACIWASAAIGLAVGMSYYVGAIAATFIIFATLFFVERVEKILIIGNEYRLITIIAKEDQNLTRKIDECLNSFSAAYHSINITKDNVDKKIQLKIKSFCPHNMDSRQLADKLGSIENVEKVEID